MTKPQIVQMDAGIHNEDIDGATSRIIRGGSWKKQRVVVILPSSDLIPAKIALAHRCLAMPPNQPSHWMLALGMEVGDAYSWAIDTVLNTPGINEWEYILTIEADNRPNSDGLSRLLLAMEEHPEYACIGGLYWTKGEGGVPQMWGDPKDPSPNYRPQPPVKGQVVEVCGTGMGFNLWRMSMFRDKRLRRPWFKTLTGIDGQGVGTQDLYFWNDARQYGYRCAIDCSVLVGHYDYEGKFGPPDTMW